MGRLTVGLTTHVLDTALGRPARGVRVELWREYAGDWQSVAEAVTNADGRLAVPLLGPDAEPGTYELRFFAGAYHRTLATAPASPFLEVIPVRFLLAEPAEHYHVPLLLSPYAYSTYRGS